MVVNIENIIKTLQNDGIVAIQTDTIYGVIGNPFSKLAVDKLYKIKNREKNKKLSIFLKSKEDIEKICIVDKKIKYFIENELENNTIILRKKDKKYLNLITNEDDTIGIRIPNDETLIKILKIIDFPLFATSVNLSGEQECLNYGEVLAKFSGKIDLIVDNKDCISCNRPSKIYRMVNNNLERIR